MTAGPDDRDRLSLPAPFGSYEHAIDTLPTGKYTGNKKDEILLRNEGDGGAGSGLAALSYAMRCVTDSVRLVRDGLDRVLKGGLPKGEIYLVQGDPGNAVERWTGAKTITGTLHSSSYGPGTLHFARATGNGRYLEAARRQSAPPPIIFASTNKIYGSLDVPTRVEEALPPRATFLATPLAGQVEELLQTAPQRAM